MRKGTTQDTAMHFMRTAAKSRPATSGNKNISTGARRMSASSQMPASRTRPIVGPDKGMG